MNCRRIGIICQIFGTAVAIGGLLPLAVRFYRYLFAPKSHDPFDEIYFGTTMLKLAIVAVVSVAVGYILVRVGSHLKSKHKTDLPST